MTDSDVRPLRGEDLEHLDWADALERARSFVEAARLVPRVDEFDYLAACAGDRVVGIGAAGYRTPFGGASLVSLSVDPRVRAFDPALDPTARLLARLEQRAWELTCTSVEVCVLTEDVRARTAFEFLGYGIVGATTNRTPATPLSAAIGSPARDERHVDSWVLRKDL